MNALTHASFFSGVGGLDMGLERAGWRTVSFSEIDPYASAVLAERWPGVPNLGDIVRLAAGSLGDGDAAGPGAEPLPDETTRAVLWTGGFPCQDLSVAGKRRGMGTENDRTRSGLAYAFLDLVEQHRPPAILLENVPGLLSSNAGRDLGALLGRLGELGYWWAYRILDAQFFGVPQRRRRVFICALHAGAGFGADSPAAVLSVGTRCGGHSAASDEARTAASAVASRGADDPGFFNATARFGEFVEGDTAGNLSARDYKSANHLIRETPDSDRVREADGLAGRPHHRELSPTLRCGPARPQDGGPGDTEPIIVNALDQRRGGADDNEAQAGHLISGGNDGGFRTEPGEHLVAYRKSARVNADPDSNETWVNDGLANTLNNFDVGDVRTTHAVVGGRSGDSDLLPLGLDSHRYRCCGNGVVSNVSEWIGVRLARVFT